MQEIDNIEFLASTYFWDIFAGSWFWLFFLGLVFYWKYQGHKQGEIKKGTVRGVRIISKVFITFFILGLCLQIYTYILVGLKKESRDYKTISGKISHYIDTNDGRDFIIGGGILQSFR